MRQLDYDYIVESVAQIEADTFSDGWSLDSVKETMEQVYNKIYFLYGDENIQVLYVLKGKSHRVDMLISTLEETNLKNGQLLGYIISNEIAGESELLRIAVDEKYRNKKFGSFLLRAYIDDEKKFCHNFFLEVREGNASAKALYEKYFFEQIGIRKNYYSNPTENAVIYGINFNK